MQCTKCNSDHTQRASVIYEQGTSDIQTKGHSSGVAVGSDGGLAFGSSTTTTRGTQSTRLAKRLSPPGHRMAKLALGLSIVPALFLVLGENEPGITLVSKSFLALAALGLLGYAVGWELTVRKPRVEIWERTWFCNRCGQVFVQRTAGDTAITKVKQGMGTPTNLVGLGSVVSLCLGLYLAISTLDSTANAPAPGKASAEKAHHKAVRADR